MLTQWFQALGLYGQICLCFAAPATIVLLVQIILSMIGLSDGGMGLPDGAEDAALDMPDDIDDLTPSALDGFHIFTARTIISFFVAFGWMGVSLSGTSLSPTVAMLISLGFGLLVMFLVALLMYGIYRLQSDGTADNRNALGTAGTVYMTIPAQRTGRGKVNVMLQGAYVERDAVTDDGEAIPTGAEIVVVGVSGMTTLVVKRK
jgi:membrane protein implicated in regulation of membrane protease activity